MPINDPTRPPTPPERTSVDILVFGVEHAQLTEVTGGDNERGEHVAIGLSVGPHVGLILAAHSDEGLARFATTIAAAARDRRRPGRPATD